MGARRVLPLFGDDVMSKRGRRGSCKRCHVSACTTAAVAGALLACGAVHAASSTWTAAGGGNWGTAANWSAGVPNGTSDVATFGTAITAPSVITQNVIG